MNRKKNGETKYTPKEGGPGSLEDLKKKGEGKGERERDIE
jgi:hypothetical protein